MLIIGKVKLDDSELMRAVRIEDRKFAKRNLPAEGFEHSNCCAALMKAASRHIRRAARKGLPSFAHD